MTFPEFWHPLTAVYDMGEARAIARIVMERHFGLSLPDIACGAVESLDALELSAIRSRLLTGEPVQYILGEAEFCGRCFHVEPGVLIPRPETEWLCHRAVSLMSGREGSVLDIGTGSGCIACTLALDMAGHAEVEAWDISDSAIAVARSNAAVLGAHVTVYKTDALNPPADRQRWDLIVSNPPYICLRERKDMHQNVLRYEPGEALFVPDEDPLLFYRAIAKYASKALKPAGTLLFELNPVYSEELQTMATSLGFCSVTIEKDDYGKKRYAVIRH